MKHKPKRFVIVAPKPTPEQLTHVATLEGEGYEVTLLPEQHGKPLDFATAYTLAMQQRMDEARSRLRTTGRISTRPTSSTEP